MLVECRKEKIVQKFLKVVVSSVAALVLQSGNVYAQATIEVYKSPT